MRMSIRRLDTLLLRILERRQILLYLPLRNVLSSRNWLRMNKLVHTRRRRPRKLCRRVWVVGNDKGTVGKVVTRWEWEVGKTARGLPEGSEGRDKETTEDRARGESTRSCCTGFYFIVFSNARSCYRILSYIAIALPGVSRRDAESRYAMKPRSRSLCRTNREKRENENFLAKFALPPYSSF